MLARGRFLRWREGPDLTHRSSLHNLINPEIQSKKWSSSKCFLFTFLFIFVVVVVGRKDWVDCRENDEEINIFLLPEVKLNQDVVEVDSGLNKMARVNK